MALRCGLSNEIPKKPVLSPKSNSIFEKELIKRYIVEHGIDPITGDALTIEDLIPIYVPKEHASNILKEPKNVYMFFKQVQDEVETLMQQTLEHRDIIDQAQLGLNRAMCLGEAQYILTARMRRLVSSARRLFLEMKAEEATQNSSKKILGKIQNKLKKTASKSKTQFKRKGK